MQGGNCGAHNCCISGNLTVAGTTVTREVESESLSFDRGENTIDQIVNGGTWEATVTNGSSVTGTGVVSSQTYEKIGRILVGHFRVTGLTTGAAGALHSFYVDLPEPPVDVPSCTASAVLAEFPAFNYPGGCGFTDFSPENTMLFLWRTVAANQTLVVYVNMHYQTDT